MIQIGDTLISLDIFEKHFECDLPKCLGACCVEGESGAPLEEHESRDIEVALEKVLPALPKQSREVITTKGAWLIDLDGDMVTPLRDGKECVYTCFNNKGYATCAFEIAYFQGLISFRKPISCQLYPIRITKYDTYLALNYHEWYICAGARKKGSAGKIPVFRFLREGLVRKFGEPFYQEMEEAYNLLNEIKDVKPL